MYVNYGGFIMIGDVHKVNSAAVVKYLEEEVENKFEKNASSFPKASKEVSGWNLLGRFSNWINEKMYYRNVQAWVKKSMQDEYGDLSEKLVEQVNEVLKHDKDDIINLAKKGRSEVIKRIVKKDMKVAYYGLFYNKLVGRKVPTVTIHTKTNKLLDTDQLINERFQNIKLSALIQGGKEYNPGYQPYSFNDVGSQRKAYWSMSLGGYSMENIQKELLNLNNYLDKNVFDKLIQKLKERPDIVLGDLGKEDQEALKEALRSIAWIQTQKNFQLGYHNLQHSLEASLFALVAKVEELNEGVDNLRKLLGTDDALVPDQIDVLRAMDDNPLRCYDAKKLDLRRCFIGQSLEEVNDLVESIANKLPNLKEIILPRVETPWKPTFGHIETITIENVMAVGEKPTIDLTGCEKLKEVVIKGSSQELDAVFIRVNQGVNITRIKE